MSPQPTPRHYALWAFFLLAFGLSWSLWVPAALASHGLIPFSLSPTIPGILGAFGPSLAGLILTAVIEGWVGLRILFKRLWLWRVGLRWYLFVLLWPALLSLSVTGLAILLGQPALDFANPPLIALYPIPLEVLQIGWWLFLPFVFSNSSPSVAPWGRVGLARLCAVSPPSPVQCACRQCHFGLAVGLLAFAALLDRG